MKKIICFDLDGTLTESKTDIAPQTVDLLAELQKIKIVSVIGGASFKQFEIQFLRYITYHNNLYILPASGASFYQFEDNEWQEIYKLKLSENEKQQIFEAFRKTFLDINYNDPPITYGEIIEDRECEVVFSTLGQRAPLAERLALKYDRRPEIINSLKKYLSKFKISMSGVNSIDVTRIGIDKGYAIEQIQKYFDVNLDEMVFVGDAIYEGRHDFAVVRTGIETVKVTGPADTMKFIKSLILFSSPDVESLDS